MLCLLQEFSFSSKFRDCPVTLGSLRSRYAQFSASTRDQVCDLRTMKNHPAFVDVEKNHLVRNAATDYYLLLLLL